jgi:DNA-binding response OmpR family regulator
MVTRVPPAGTLPPRPRRPLTVAVLEDDRPTALLYDSILTPEGFHVAIFAHNAPCRAFVRDQHPDLLIVDVVADTQNGLTLLGQICDDLGSTQPPVIIATALQRYQFRRHPALSRLRQSLTLLKPFEMDDLLEAVYRLVPHPQAPLATYC